jgi:hypothetical protein
MPPSRNPLQESIDRIRAAQQAQAQPQYSAEDVFAATSGGVAEDAWRSFEATRDAREPNPAPADYPAPMPAAAEDSWQYPSPTTFSDSARDFNAEQAQQWMNQQAAGISADLSQGAARSEGMPPVVADDWEQHNAGQQTAATQKEMMEEAISQQASNIPEQPPGPIAPIGESHRRGDAARIREARRKGGSGAPARAPERAWSDPAEAPLPGEETLHPAVAQWNQTRTSAGRGDGLSQLRTAYDIEQKSQAVPPGMTFEQWVESKGLDPDTPPMEAQAILERIVSQNMSQFPDHDPLSEGIKYDPRVNRRDDSVLSGREALADGTPLDLMSEEQRMRLGTGRDGSPRTARGGDYVYDPLGGKEGEGGYVLRAADLDAANAARESGDLRGEAAAFGIDHMAYGDNLPQLEADIARARQRHEKLARNYKASPVAGGGQRLVLNEQGQQRQDYKRAQQYAAHRAKLFAKELQEAGVPADSLKTAYLDWLAKHPGDYVGAAQYVERGYLDSLRLNKEQDEGLRMKKFRDQTGRAQVYGTSRGTISMFDSLQAAQSPEERANLLMLAHANAPQMGWDKMAAMLMKGEIDNNAMSQWAAQMQGNKNPSDQIAQTVQGINNSPMGMDTYAQWQHHVRSMPGFEKATDDQIKAEVRRYAMPQIQQRLASGEPLNQNEVGFMRSVMPVDFGDFSAAVGIPQADPRAAQLYQEVHGKPPSAGIMGNLAAGMGWLFGNGFSPNAMAGTPTE